MGLARKGFLGSSRAGVVVCIQVRDCTPAHESRKPTSLRLHRNFSEAEFRMESDPQEKLVLSPGSHPTAWSPSLALGQGWSGGKQCLLGSGEIILRPCKTN